MENYHLEVDFPRSLQSAFSGEQVQALIKLLAADPRPAYQRDPERIYGMPFAGKDIRFRVADGRLTVQEIMDL